MIRFTCQFKINVYMLYIQCSSKICKQQRFGIRLKLENSNEAIAEHQELKGSPWGTNQRQNQLAFAIFAWRVAEDMTGKMRYLAEVVKSVFRVNPALFFCLHVDMSRDVAWDYTRFKEYKYIKESNFA